MVFTPNTFFQLKNIFNQLILPYKIALLLEISRNLIKLKV